MERWLNQIFRRERVRRLEEDTAAYYDALTKAEREEDAAWAMGSSGGARKLQIDERPSKPAATGTRRPVSRRKR